MRQIVYVSSSTSPTRKTDLGGILEQSRHNNAIDGITGLLWSDGDRFLQVFEGPEESVDATFARIRQDSRHHEITVLHDRSIETREFGNWTMAHRQPGEPADAHDARIRRLLSNASDEVRQPFLALIAPGESAG